MASMAGVDRGGFIKVPVKFFHQKKEVMILLYCKWDATHENVPNQNVAHCNKPATSLAQSLLYSNIRTRGIVATQADLDQLAKQGDCVQWRGSKGVLECYFSASKQLHVQRTRQSRLGQLLVNSLRGHMQLHDGVQLRSMAGILALFRAFNEAIVAIMGSFGQFWSDQSDFDAFGCRTKLVFIFAVEQLLLL